MRPTPSFLAASGTLGVLAALYRTVGDTTWWGECFTVWPPGGWCALLLPRLALLVWRRRRFESAGLALAMAAFLGVTVEWPSRRPGDDATRFDGERRAETLRLVTWNVAGGRPLRDLEALRPDLCFLQEGGLGGHPLDGPWTGYRALATVDPATVSRYPFRSLPTRKVGPWSEPQVLRVDLPSGRAVVAVNVRLVLPTLVVALATLETPRGFLEAHRERVAQFPRLRDLMVETLAREGTDLGVLCGDFNTPGESRSLLLLGPTLRDVWPEAGVGWGVTMPDAFPMSRIDQCWVTAPLRPIRAEVRRGESDHRLLVVDLQLPE